MARTVRVLGATAGLGWASAVGLVVVRATEAVGAWATTAASVIGAAASTATLAAIFLATLPGVLLTWHEGIDYGRRLEQAERGIPAQVSRRHLTTVR